MPYIDLHCDTLFAILTQNPTAEPRTIEKNLLHVDLQKLRASDCALQVFAIFTDASRAHALPHALSQAELFHRIVTAYPVFFDASQFPFAQGHAQRRIGALLSLEDAGVCESDPMLLRLFYRLGVRMMTLTWNHENSLAAPRGALGGLTKKGVAYLALAQELGILIDVSHLSDRGVYDVLERSRAPVIASHANARAICPHPRNLTDDMIRGIAATGGVIGLNLYPPFLSRDGDGSFDALLRHAAHVASVGGVDCLAIGSDFDGFDGNPHVPDAAALAALPDLLRRYGFSLAEAEAILWRNALRVLPLPRA